LSDALDRALPPFQPGDSEPYFVPQPLPSQDRVWLHVVLFLITVVTTTLTGGCHYLSFEHDFIPQPPIAQDQIAGFVMGLLTDPAFYLRGLWYSLTVLAILGCHEMGHYLVCRYYRVDASLPFFLPVPPVLLLTGTLGAFIRIRSRIPSKIALFDIGIAGPIAGFVIAVPALFIGLSLSRVVRMPEDLNPEFLLSLGEPLLFRGAAWLVFGEVPEGYSINMHPMAFAAWFGLLATALNLFPIGQLDGGHVAYAVMGRRSSIVSIAMVVAAIGLTWVSLSWVVWTILMVLMLAITGPHHPPTLDDDMQMDRPRLVLAMIAVVMLIVCFTPAPLEPFVTGR
jgi:membrane-associated protease RseP (regulator of RpoE activity)